MTAIVSVADDGGSSGRLRQLLQIIPPGDLRKCLVALAEPGSPLAAAFEYRFGEEELAGHSLGNLILAGLIDGAPDPVAALDEACRLLGRPGAGAAGDHRAGGPQGRVPTAGQVDGQVAVMATDHIRTVSLVPADPKAPVEAMAALAAADQIILGPGSLFTSVLAAVAVPDIRQGIARSAARKVYVCNLRPQVPETEEFDVGMHVDALAAHGVPVDMAVCDTSGLSAGHAGRGGRRHPSGPAQRPGPRPGETGVGPLGSARMMR